ncbi:MAG: methyltransferase domain-containing protein [Patescibacteria group bacterium]|jgi:predicted SAM-dependent methyltransferase
MQEHLDKIGLRDALNSPKVILNLGGGNTKEKDVINLDIIDLPQVDVVANLEEGLQFIPNDSVDEIRAYSFLEHIEDLDLLMREMYRVLKPGGIVDIFVPHFSNPYYYSDFTHKRFFGYYSFYYFSKNQEHLLRKVPSFYDTVNFGISSQKIIFRNAFAKYHIINILSQKLFNKTTKLQEIYEVFFSHLIPCNGLEVVLKK